MTSRPAYGAAHDLRDGPPGGGRMDRITEITKDCFNALAQLRNADAGSLPAPEELQSRLRGFVDALFQKASAAGLRARGGLRRRLCGGRARRRARAHLAVRPPPELLERAAAAAALLPRERRRRGVLHPPRRDPEGSRAAPRCCRAYYLALLFGFQGRYRVRGGELELMGLVDGVARELGAPRQRSRDALAERRAARRLPSRAARAAGRCSGSRWARSRSRCSSTSRSASRSRPPPTPFTAGSRPPSLSSAQSPPFGGNALLRIVFGILVVLVTWAAVLVFSLPLWIAIAVTVAAAVVAAALFAYAPLPGEGRRGRDREDAPVAGRGAGRAVRPDQQAEIDAMQAEFQKAVAALKSSKLARGGQRRARGAALVHDHRPAGRRQEHGARALRPAVPLPLRRAAAASAASAAPATATGGSPTRRCCSTPPAATPPRTRTATSGLVPRHARAAPAEEADQRAHRRGQRRRPRRRDRGGARRARASGSASGWTR